MVKKKFEVTEEQLFYAYTLKEYNKFFCVHFFNGKEFNLEKLKNEKLWLKFISDTKAIYAFVFLGKNMANQESLKNMYRVNFAGTAPYIVPFVGNSIDMETLKWFDMYSSCINWNLLSLTISKTIEELWSYPKYEGVNFSYFPALYDFFNAFYNKLNTKMIKRKIITTAVESQQILELSNILDGILAKEGGINHG